MSPHRRDDLSEATLRSLATAARDQVRHEQSLDAAHGLGPRAGDLWILPDPTEGFLGLAPQPALAAAHEAADVEWLVLEVAGPGYKSTATIVAVDVMPLAGLEDILLGPELGGPLTARGGLVATLPLSVLAAGQRTGRLELEALDRIETRRQRWAEGSPTPDVEAEETQLDPEYRAWQQEVLEPAQRLVTALAALETPGGESRVEPGAAQDVEGATGRDHEVEETPPKPSPFESSRTSPGNSFWRNRTLRLAATLALGLAGGYHFSSANSGPQIEQLNDRLRALSSTDYSTSGSITLEPDASDRSETFLMKVQEGQPRHFSVIVNLTEAPAYVVVLEDVDSNETVLRSPNLEPRNGFHLNFRVAPEELPLGRYRLRLFRKDGDREKEVGVHSFTVVSLESTGTSDMAPDASEGN